MPIITALIGCLRWASVSAGAAADELEAVEEGEETGGAEAALLAGASAVLQPVSSRPTAAAVDAAANDELLRNCRRESPVDALVGTFFITISVL